MSRQESDRLDDVVDTLREDPETHRRLVRALVRIVVEEERRSRRLQRLRTMDR